METNEAKFGHIYFAPFYSGDIVRSKEIPETSDGKERMWKIKIRPHFSMRHMCDDFISKIPIEDKARRDGDYLILTFPLRLRRTISTEPSHTVYFLKCNIKGEEINDLGLPDEQYAEQLRNANVRITQLKIEMAKKDKTFNDFIQKRDIISEIANACRETIAQEMRMYQQRDKETK